MRTDPRAISGITWAMHRPALEAVLHGADRSRGTDAPSGAQMAITRRAARPLEGASQAYRIDGVGVMPVIGSVRPRGFSIMDWLLGTGGFVLEHAARDLQLLLEDPGVTAIVFDVSSPGGMAEGVQEFAQMVFAARGQKPLVAYAGGMAASAAYWVAAAADEIVINPTGEAGSIGVVATYIDLRGMQAQAGIQEIEFVSSQSPNKRADPMKAEGAALIQRRVDDMAEVFVQTMAQYRGVSRDDVIQRFGAGDVMVGQRAIDAGLADNLGSFDEVLSELRIRLGGRRAMSTPTTSTSTVPPRQTTPPRSAAPIPTAAELESSALDAAMARAARSVSGLAPEAGTRSSPAPAPFPEPAAHSEAELDAAADRAAQAVSAEHAGRAGNTDGDELDAAIDRAVGELEV